MASISNIKLSAAKATGAGNTWDLTVTYDANFSPFEVANFNFRDGFVVWEEDDWPNPDDQLTGVVGVTQFNPTATPTRRTMRHRISGSTLDTEWFGEEIYVVVRLRNLDLNLLYTKKSGVLHLNP
jgi:hypothetical protein